MTLLPMPLPSLDRNRNAALGDIKWRDVDLTSAPWEEDLRRLGDEGKGQLTMGGEVTFTEVPTDWPNPIMVRAQCCVMAR